MFLYTMILSDAGLSLLLNGPLKKCRNLDGLIDVATHPHLVPDACDINALRMQTVVYHHALIVSFHAVSWRTTQYTSHLMLAQHQS